VPLIAEYPETGVLVWEYGFGDFRVTWPSDDPSIRIARTFYRKEAALNFAAGKNKLRLRDLVDGVLASLREMAGGS
jgi:hypothetical protein